jgi:1-acyl-sn-glycerol-3-phosphate acyltransferase
MKKTLAYILSTIYYINWLLLLLLFHPIQVIAYNLLGYSAHKKVVDILNYFLIWNLYTLLCRPTFHGFDTLPTNKPLIIISNHQSMFDISPVVVGFRRHHAKFISKKELGKYLPSVSYNLRKGGSVLIDRNNGSQSIKEIFRLGKLLEQKNYSACIFPEGTRSKTGLVKHFQPAGIKTLLKASPSAIIVPLVIDGNYKLHKYGMFPLNIGIHLKYTALDPINREGYTDDALIELVEHRIKMALSQA